MRNDRDGKRIARERLARIRRNEATTPQFDFEGGANTAPKQGPRSTGKVLDSHLSKELAFQLRQLRDNREWTQDELATKLGTSQNAISRLENPNYGKASTTTLKKLAAIYDVGLIVRFVSYSQLVNWESGTPYVEYGFGPDSIDVASFDEEEESGAFSKQSDLHPILVQELAGQKTPEGSGLSAPLMNGSPAAYTKTI